MNNTEQPEVSPVRIHWVNPETGACGCGEPMARSVAEAFIQDVATRLPELQHWIAEE